MTLALLAGILIGGLTYSWLSQHRVPEEAAGEELHEEHARGVVTIGGNAQRTAGIEIGEAALRPVHATLTVTGVVAPDLNRVAQVRPLAQGVVKTVHVQLGQRVAPGDPLIDYDNADLGLAIGEFLSARAELERSQTNLEVKRQILARSAEMLEVGALAGTTYDIREAEYKDARARVRSAQAAVSKVEEQLHRFGLGEEDITELGAGESSEYHRTASHSVLRAPHAGIVTAYNVAAGELVSPAGILMTITGISTVWVLADVYEKDLASVRVGQSVEIRVASYPGEIFHGEITYIADVIDPATRTAKVRCVVANPGYRLKLEMFANVAIPTGRRIEVLAVPAEAIQILNGQKAVFVPTTDTEFRLQAVQTGEESDGWTEVRAGVTAGDPVVAAGSFYLKTAFLRDLIGEGH
jgi:cobalt-zinc-cadmium efflux system membrane fusion protein